MDTTSSIAPPYRRLRVYAFDPSLALRLKTAPINEITIRAAVGGAAARARSANTSRWSTSIRRAAWSIRRSILNDPNLLAQDGLRPSEGNPQFHQQMVYAVAMTTIGHFERALGRVALWAPRRVGQPRSPTGQWQSQFVRRLRIYPHALRDQNAYYSPDKKALLFGYFPVHGKDADNTPGTHGVHLPVARHRRARDHARAARRHASALQRAEQSGRARLSRGVRRHRRAVPALLLSGRAARPDRADARRSRAARACSASSRSSSAARPAGARRCATRSASDGRRRLGTAQARSARAGKIAGAARARRDPGRGRVRRVPADLSRAHRRPRSASPRQGTGMLPEGDIHPDLANRLAEEAARSAQTVLQMCIRALDYCPPVDITFGDYLRAIVTADVDFNPDDEFGYRVAIDRELPEWGIYPRGIRSMSIEALDLAVRRRGHRRCTDRTDADAGRSIVSRPRGHRRRRGRSRRHHRLVRARSSPTAKTPTTGRSRSG